MPSVCVHGATNAAFATATLHGRSLGTAVNKTSPDLRSEKGSRHPGSCRPGTAGLGGRRLTRGAVSISQEVQRLPLCGRTELRHRMARRLSSPLVSSQLFHILFEGLLYFAGLQNSKTTCRLCVHMYVRMHLYVKGTQEYKIRTDVVKA